MPLHRTVRPTLELLEDRCLLSVSSRPFLAVLHEDLYGPNTPAARMRTWERLLDHGLTQSQLLERVVDAPALRRHIRGGGYQRMVRQWYRRFLRREADPRGLRAFTEALRAGLSPQRALAFLLASPEYRRRAQRPAPMPQPNPAPLAAPAIPAISPQTSVDDHLVNRAVATDDGVQHMPSVAVNPLDRNHVAIAYLDYSLKETGYAGIGVSVSRDGGETWQHGEIPLPENFEQGAATPTARFDDQGRVFVSFAAATFLGSKPTTTDTSNGTRSFGLQSNNGIFVARSDDGGSTWNTPIAVVSHLYDGQTQVPFDVRPDIAIDTFRNLPNGQPNPHYGNLYATFSRVYPAGQFPGQSGNTGGGDVMLAVSEDAGQTWQLRLQPQPGTGIPISAIQHSGNTNNQNAPLGASRFIHSHIAIGPEGDLYISSFDSANIGVRHSTDAGQSFAAPDYTTNNYLPFGANARMVPTPNLPGNQFRTHNVRVIAADPLRPGHVYVVEAVNANDSAGNILDAGDIVFSRSTDYGITWQTTFKLDGRDASVLNDDNDGLKANRRADDVITGQALPQLASDEQGNLAVIWYDTRRDPANVLLDVFATVSSDGGQTFGPNFRLTDQSFNANDGRFTSATGTTEFYMGDLLGLALDHGTGYAAWTDTRDGNQDIVFTRYGLNPPPAPLNDRFEPNDTPDLSNSPTQLGRVIKRTLPKLEVSGPDQDWFHFQSVATGTLTASGLQTEVGDRLRLELFDGNGTTRLAEGTPLLNEEGEVIGQQVVFPSKAGQFYQVRVTATTASETRYALTLQALTADFGLAVYGQPAGSLNAGDEAVYALTAAAIGSLEVTLTPGANAQGNFRFNLLDPNTLAILASGQLGANGLQASLPTRRGQGVLLHVVGEAGASGDFTLEYRNLDQYSTLASSSFFFPVAASPSQAVVADFNGDDNPDIAVSQIGTDTVSVLLGNGDGTFQSPRQFAVGAFVQGNPSTLIGLDNYRRDLVAADVDRDGNLDVIVGNHGSSDVSILLGRGDGTFESQRRVNATAAPFALDTGDVNKDNIDDLVIVDSRANPAQQGGSLLGRGDGSFQLLAPFDLPSGQPNRTNAIRIADLDGDGNNDLVTTEFESGVLTLRGNGDGTFGTATQVQPGGGPGLAVGDLNGDDIPDIVTTFYSRNQIVYSLGNGDGTFQPLVRVSVGQSPVAVAIADFGSQVTVGGVARLGPPDGVPDVIVADNGLLQATFNGPPDIQILPGRENAQGQWIGFGTPLRLASPVGPLDVDVEDVNGDDALDIVGVDRDGVLVIFGEQPVIPPNTTPQTARDLGTVVHLLQSTLTLVPGREEAHYALIVPTEAATGAGDAVLDFSGRFEAGAGAGISMEVRDSSGNLLGSGERFRVRAAQGEMLTLQVFGVEDTEGVRGSGAYTLNVVALPQLVSVQSQALLPGAGDQPGGPTASLVLTFQGERLDPVAAENPNHYRITWHGADAVLATNDDVTLTVASATYNASSNRDVATGQSYPTAVRQTVTLLFDNPLPAGSYTVEVLPGVQAAPFSDAEDDLLTPREGFTGHPVVTLDGNTVGEGARLTALDLVVAQGPLSDFTEWKIGTPFLTQLHGDLAALLDAGLTQLGDAPSITAAIQDAIQARLTPTLGPVGTRPTGVLVIWLDPVSIDLTDPEGDRIEYDLQTDTYTNTFEDAFALVTGNIEVIVIPTFGGDYLLEIADVPDTARGGVVFLGTETDIILNLTEPIRDGTTSFPFSFPGEP